MSRSTYRFFPIVAVAPAHSPISSMFALTSMDCEIPDPADIYASRYRQLLPPHPFAIGEEPPPPSPPPRSNACEHKTCESFQQQSDLALQMPPLTDIGRPTSTSQKPHARNVSNASKRTRQSLPRIEEVPDLDSDTNSMSSGCLSRSSSSSSNVSTSTGNDPYYPSYHLPVTSEMAQEYMKMNQREAAIRASMERTSWMIDEDEEKGSRDLTEHINYVLSAWQRDR